MGPSPEEAARTDKSLNVCTPSARLSDKKCRNFASGTADKQMIASGGKVETSNKLSNCEISIDSVF